ncbi:hypothetical protein BaRGS_00008289 [Batillaria attramentaria]|uniref:Uncharacterized protein n=1 Tax=Batillaria attramentaria TaxID=370345 RepID=A0ABD0LMW6_9CAEN
MAAQSLAGRDWIQKRPRLQGDGEKVKKRMDGERDGGENEIQKMRDAQKRGGLAELAEGGDNLCFSGSVWGFRKGCSWGRSPITFQQSGATSHPTGRTSVKFLITQLLLLPGSGAAVCGPDSCMLYCVAAASYQAFPGYHNTA